MMKLELTSIQSEQLRDVIRAWLKNRQELARKVFINNQDGLLLAAELSEIIDQLIAELFAYVTKNMAKKSAGSRPALTIIATGGYGRRELSPYSDIDLLFLYEKSASDEAGEISEAILYQLWDAGLKTGHAHRTIEETIELARADINVRTSLLDARLIVGDKNLEDEFKKILQNEIIEGSVLAFVEAKLAERDARHARFGDSRYVLEPNVKEGKGGLRDLHTLWWLARYAYNIETLDDLCKAGHINEEELAAFNQARQFLLRTRAHLHYLSNHADERLSFDKQLSVAKATGYNNSSPNLSITRFMRRYFIAVRTVGSLTRIFCALLEEEKKRKPQKPLGWIRLDESAGEQFVLDGERLSIDDEELFVKQPDSMLRLFEIAQNHGLDIHPRALRAITRNLRIIDDSFRKSPDNCRSFLHILQSPKGPEIALRRMNEAGVLGRFIPEFGRIIGQTQFNMYHAYTVDEHTLMALGILHSIDQGIIRDEAPLASEIMPRIDQKHLLYLALFCHDIAKGRGGDHSQLGEKIAIKLGRRFGLGEDECATTAWLVRNHLLLSATAFKRDLNDPKTIEDFVAEVRTTERLKLLLVMTVADIRAVGPGIWNEWKGALMRDLFHRSMQAIGSMENLPTKNTPQYFQEALENSCRQLSREEIADYIELAAGSGGFLSGCSLSQHMAIAPMLCKMQKNKYGEEENKRKVQISVTHDDKKSTSEIIVVLPDRQGLFAKLAGAITLAGANIVHAKIFTLKDASAVDIFHLQNKAGSSFNRPSMLARMVTYIEQAVEGELDLQQALAKRATTYTNRNHHFAKRDGAVFIENDASSLCSVIEIDAHDRIGLLYNVATALNELGLSIATAHISTYGAQAADVFYVKNAFGMKITHPEKIKSVRDTITTIL